MVLRTAFVGVERNARGVVVVQGLPHGSLRLEYGGAVVLDGFDQGFDIYDDRAGRVFGYQPVGHRLLEFLPYVRDCVSKSYREAEAVNRSVFEWLDQSARSQRPFFLFVNYMEPHVPFCAPKPFDEKYGRPTRSYRSPPTRSSKATG